ncbi:hypothetical protein DAPPUDRAFT_304673 [Daphnia pulex]|uniref:Uncharacterized protein n=1 Tax=Daphnia pulex TaxID=6669 RepID=E9FVN2_DAPPU|nr:hypothetical protein DAPPUDRAFT_304673 [Daphnia pulex]|eukprot:EFX88583.1 hypothetical protein DAPPUDRAFT_304673 [Daphnia pulex]
MVLAVNSWIKLCPLDGANASVNDEKSSISSEDTERKGSSYSFWQVKSAFLCCSLMCTWIGCSHSVKGVIKLSC